MWIGNLDAQLCGTQFPTTAAPICAPFEGSTAGENGILNGCFYHNVGPTTNDPYWQADVGGTGSSGTGPTVDHTLGTTAGSYIYLETSTGAGQDTFFSSPYDLSGMTVPCFSYWYHMAGATMGTLDVQISVVGSGTWTTISTFTGPQQAAQTDPWLESVSNLSAYAGQTVIFQFIGIRGTSFTGDMAIDDVCVLECPSCVAPTNLTATNITVAGADLAWTEGNAPAAPGWEIEWGPVGFAPGSGTIIGTTTNPHTLAAALMEFACYDYYVKAICTAADTSMQAGPHTFCVPGPPFLTSSMSCPPGSSPLPFWTEDFNSSADLTPPAGWTQTSAVGDDANWEVRPYTWTSSSSTGPDATNFASCDAAGGKYMMTETSGNNNLADTTISTAITMPAMGPLELKFDYYMYGLTIDYLRFGVSTDGGATFTTLASQAGQVQTTGAQPWTTVYVDLSAYAGQTINLVFVGAQLGTGFTADIMLDCIELRECASCAPPTIDSLVYDAVNACMNVYFTSLTGDSILLDYGPTGFTPGDGTAANLEAIETLGNSPYCVPWAGECESFDIAVAAVCNTGADTSAYSSIVSAVPPPTNDECVNAIPLMLNSCDTFCNNGATAGADPASCGLVGEDVWFSIVVPASGMVNISAVVIPGSFTDGVMEVYDNCPPLGSVLACSDDDNNCDVGSGAMPYVRLNDPLLAGTTVYVRFWEYGGGTFGQFAICAVEPPACVAVAGGGSLGGNTIGGTGSQVDPYTICNGDVVDFQSDQMYTLPTDPCTGGALPNGGNSWLVFTAAGYAGTGDPTLDPNYLTIFEADTQGLFSAAGGSFCIYPFTDDFQGDGLIDADLDSCYAIGAPICVVWSDASSADTVMTCNSLTDVGVTVNLSGGANALTGGSWTMISSTPAGVQSGAMGETIDFSMVGQGGSVMLSVTDGCDTIDLNYTLDCPCTMVGLDTPMVMPDTIFLCMADTASATAVGSVPATLTWYDAATGGAVIDTGATTNFGGQTFAMGTTTCFWVEETDTLPDCGTFGMLITEIHQWASSTSPDYPFGTCGSVVDDWVELTNICSVASVDISGYEFRSSDASALGQRAITFPAGTIVPPGATVLIGLTSPGLCPNEPASLIFYASDVGSGDNALFSSEGVSYVLYDAPGGNIVDVAATNGEDPTIDPYFLPAPTALDWSGAMPGSGSNGVGRTSATDSNTGADWALATGATSSMGALNPGIVLGADGSGGDVCRSARKEVCIKVDNAPVPVISTDAPTQNVCENSPGFVAATCPPGYETMWYSDAAATMPVGMGDTIVIPAPGMMTTVTYYAQCECSMAAVPGEGGGGMENMMMMTTPVSCPFDDMNCFAPLPVELLSFSGTVGEGYNDLFWSTASEENTRWMIIDRSVDGVNNFVEVGRLAAAGNSNTTLDYQLRDNDPLQAAYYRLRVVDLDGTESLSRTLYLAQKTTFGLVRTFPVPTKGLVNVEFETTAKGDITFRMMDMLGRTVHTSSAIFEAGRHIKVFNMKELTSGVYAVEIDNGVETFVTKVVKND